MCGNIEPVYECPLCWERSSAEEWNRSTQFATEHGMIFGNTPPVEEILMEGNPDYCCPKCSELVSGTSIRIIDPNEPIEVEPLFNEFNRSAGSIEEAFVTTSLYLLKYIPRHKLTEYRDAMGELLTAYNKA